jgi:hypothetical protein
MMHSYEQGSVKSAADFLQRAADTASKTMRAGELGLAFGVGG